MQIQINKFLVVLLGIVLLGIGCAPPDTSQNNGIRNSNQNASNQNTPANTTPLKPITCNSVNQQNINAEIQALPPELKNQFTAGTISVTYDAAKSEMVFKGSLTNDGNNLRVFFDRFNKFRGRQCVKLVYFQGASDAAYFEWSPVAAPPMPPPDTCKTNVETTIDNSSFRSQLKKNLDYLYEDKTGILNLIGSIADIPQSNGQLNSFLGDLQKLSADGCISKIVFKGGARAGRKPLDERDFGWTLCEPPLVECAGACVSSCPDNGNTNTNINTNTNTNR
jgi:hypothetical protein